MLRLIIHTKRRCKNIVKQKVKTNEDNEEKDTNDLNCTGDESEDGQNSISHRDQDSDASVEIDSDEEINTAEIEAENCVDYINRSTNGAIEKMGHEKIRCWNKTHKK